jgi:hypothetical protein
MRVLVIGGAGYIGSHMVKMLDQQGCCIATLDDLSRDAVLRGDFVQGNFGDRVFLDTVLSRGFDAGMHFALTCPGCLSHRGPVCLAQYRDHLFFCESTFSHGLLADWEPSSRNHWSEKSGQVRPSKRFGAGGSPP